MKVSVVIPVYNVKPYLERCVQSVLSQTYKDLEIILVDDGSIDGSGVLCDDIATRDKRIHVVHQANQGISGARNAGLLRASGQYVLFLDADDEWLLKDGLEKLIQEGETTFADITIFKCVHIWNGLHKLTQNYDIELISELSNSSRIFEYLVKSQQFNMSACFLLIRKQLLLDHEIFFPIGYISEDVYWSLYLWQYVQSVAILNLDFYGYHHRQESVSSTPSLHVYHSYDQIFTYWKEQCNNGCVNAQAIRIYLANLWVNRGYNCYKLSKADRLTALTVMEEHVDLLNYAATPKACFIAWMIKLLGVKNTVFFLGLYWRLRSCLIG